MLICIPSENNKQENRVPLTPQAVKKLTQAGLTVHVQSGLGASCYFNDDQYTTAGAEIKKDAAELFKSADILLRLQKSTRQELAQLKAGAVHVSFFDPFGERELVEYGAGQKLQLVSMEMIPRTTLAQKMDALSSQASLAGYAAVIVAAQKLNRIFPMMMTPAGTISPSKVFIIGAGVAGLQAIATASRLGARVSAFDTRPVVEEQVNSLGAKFIKLDLGETGQTRGGYAKALSEQQLELQRKLMARHCASSDVVITTAKLFGRKAPLIITQNMIEAMQPGSVIVDLAVDSGGNVEGSRPDEDVIKNSVTIVGVANLPGEVAVNASEMYASNLVNFVLEFWDREKKIFNLDPENEITKGCLLTRDGNVVNALVNSIYNKG